jgi:hypothetical protein
LVLALAALASASARKGSAFESGVAVCNTGPISDPVG